jgi:deoxyribose-phosphate aldolase
MSIINSALRSDGLASYIDHTILKPTVTEMDIRKLCEEAIQYHFKAVCIPPYYVDFVRQFTDLLHDLPHPYNQQIGKIFKICTVVGFPLGYQTTFAKIAEAQKALSDGAEEIDMVINISAFKSMAYESVKAEIKALADLAHSKNAILKVIIETAYLDNFEIRIICEICEEAGADFIKTSTGFAPKGADIEQVRFMREILPPHIKIKASGGIKTYDDAIKFIEVGADRIGTSSGVEIVGM